MPYEAVEKNELVGRQGADAMISLRSSKTIGINKTALNEYFEDHTHAVLYYDEQNDRLALKPDKGEDERAYKISRSNSSGSLGCSAFLKNNDLVDDDTTYQYEPFSDNINGDAEVVAVDLDEPTNTTTRSSQDSDEEESE